MKTTRIDSDIYMKFFAFCLFPLDLIMIPAINVISEIVIKKILIQAQKLKIIVKIPGLHKADAGQLLVRKGAEIINKG